MSELAINEAQLVQVAVRGRVSHPGQLGNYSIGYDDRPTMLPGMAGVTSNIRVGDSVFAFACDHGEPGVSAEGLVEREHLALQVLACVGNRVTMTSGEAKGAIGTVTGKHAYVLIDFPGVDLMRIAPGDGLVVRACGQGLLLTEFPQVAVRNCGPELLSRLGCEPALDGRLRVPVVATLPAELMGAGLGMSAEWANCDVMLHDAEAVSRLGLSGLRIGDVVGMADQDHRYARGYEPGWTAVGILVHAMGPTPGHGVGVVTVLTAPNESLELNKVPEQNLRDLLEIPL